MKTCFDHKSLNAFMNASQFLPAINEKKKKSLIKRDEEISANELPVLRVKEITTDYHTLEDY